MIDILSRLPARTILSSKCVCKSLLDLIETREFAQSHHPKSVPGLALFQPEKSSKSMAYKIFEFEGELDLRFHELHYSIVTKFNLLRHAMLDGSANGLLFFLRNIYWQPNALYICNPLTREYIHLHRPREFVNADLQVETYGFGVSKITGQHKLVGIFITRYLKILEWQRYPESMCRVYTLGTGSWRRIEPVACFKYTRSFGAFLNENLHWLVFDFKDYPRISCFDLETELFSTFSSPHLSRHVRDREYNSSLTALGDCLCLCDNTFKYEIVIWLMKEYGVEKSWTKEFVIKIPVFASRQTFGGAVNPIKAFKDGDMLMAWKDHFLFYYSIETKTTRKVDMFKQKVKCISAILHTPSFLSLKSFGMENVNSF